MTRSRELETEEAISVGMRKAAINEEGNREGIGQHAVSCMGLLLFYPPSRLHRARKIVRELTSCQAPLI
jgi:hypothetical protein